MSATIYTCPACHAHIVGNGHTAYCVVCGTKLDSQGTREGGLDLDAARRMIGDGWYVVMAREGVKG